MNIETSQPVRWSWFIHEAIILSLFFVQNVQFCYRGMFSQLF